MNWKAIPLVSGAAACPARPHAPGEEPPGRHLGELRQAPLDLLRRAAREGAHGLARLDTGAGACLVVTDPAAIDVVLADRDAAFFKPKMELWKRVLGENVLTSEGPGWASSRRRSVRITGARYVRRAARIAARAADERLRHWTGTDTLDIHEEMRTLTLAATLRHLCGTGADFDLRGFSHHLRTVMECIHALETTSTPPADHADLQRRFSGAATELRTSVLKLVTENPGGQDDLIGLLTDGAEDPLPPHQVCDEVLAHLIAGHESTATSLAWALLLLAGHPEVTERVRAEIDAAVGDRAPEDADLARMPLLRAVFLEALRLYPPAWTIMRATGRPSVVGDVRIPPGTVLLASPYGVQRSDRWFDGPDEFRPERWLGGARNGDPKYTFFPFGGGRRSCPGRQLALVTGGVVLTRVLQGYSLAPVGDPPRAAVDIILRPRPGTRLRATPRRPEPAGHRKESR